MSTPTKRAIKALIIIGFIIFLVIIGAIILSNYDNKTDSNSGNLVVTNTPTPEPTPVIEEYTSVIPNDWSYLYDEECLISVPRPPILQEKYVEQFEPRENEFAPIDLDTSRAWRADIFESGDDILTKYLTVYYRHPVLDQGDSTFVSVDVLCGSNETNMTFRDLTEYVVGESQIVSEELISMWGHIVNVVKIETEFGNETYYLIATENSIYQISFTFSPKEDMANQDFVEETLELVFENIDIYDAAAAMNGWRYFESELLDVSFYYPPDTTVEESVGSGVEQAKNINVKIAGILESQDDRSFSSINPTLVRISTQRAPYTYESHYEPNNPYELENLEPVIINGVEYEFEIYGLGEGSLCSGGGISTYFIEITDELNLHIDRFTSVLSCDEDDNPLPVEQYIRKKTYDSDIENGRILLSTLEF